MNRKLKIVDGNEAAATIAFKTNEVIVIYPITPSSPMGEWVDIWAASRETNMWGTTPVVQEMQSEGGAAGAVHGALQTGSLTTTFTASQGLLLMIPNMYKIAGELTPTVFHVASRSVATQALSIFGDHSDVMATRSTGFALLASASVQEVLDFALIAQAATLKSRIPFLHFFDGFRTSHEVSKIEMIPDDTLKNLIDETCITAHRSRALSPDRPVLRGSAQNPDVYFQARESVNPFYEACPAIVEETMKKFGKAVGRSYQLFDYSGDPQAERVIVMMGSGSETVQETVRALRDKGEKVGLLKVRLYRPFSLSHFLRALPSSTQTLAVLDRTKEPGSPGEPLYLDVKNAVTSLDGLERFPKTPLVLGGRYGLSSKEFTPAMSKAIYDEMRKKKPKTTFTVGLQDDITHLSLDVDPSFITEPQDEFHAVFFGLGADGTVSSNKNTLKIIGEETQNFVQGYFVYDSKKSGSVTISHLRFGPHPIHSPYLVQRVHFLGCHQFIFLEHLDVLSKVVEGGVFLLNSPYGPGEVWAHLPTTVQKKILEKNLKFYAIDAYKVARENRMGVRINTIMQTCFFAISGILPKEEAIQSIKDMIHKAYGKKGEEIVKMNMNAVDQTLSHLHEVPLERKNLTGRKPVDPVPGAPPDFMKNVLGPILLGRGDALPVSAFPVDGTYPTGTAQWEKRNIAQETPVWDENVCIQCGKCAIVCPHAVIRAKVFDPKYLKKSPDDFKTAKAKNRDWAGMIFSLQVSRSDCTGCGICVDICPAKNKSETRLKAINMVSRDSEPPHAGNHWEFFKELPEFDRRQLKREEIRSSQLFQPLFEFSGACAGCGETPYLKLLSQLFGDRAVVANATGCSSIYGGNLPTTPWAKNKEGRGPAWSNSLFEDNAEFGLGFRLSIDKQTEMALELLKSLETSIGTNWVRSIAENHQQTEADIFEQRENVERLKKKLRSQKSTTAKRLLELSDYLVRKSVWIVGGDGWAYDIGFGGLDHVLASGRDVNILVLDTEVYSNTGGQMSKSTPLGAVAKFAVSGKPNPKKDLGLIAMSYENVYVAKVALGARDEHTVRAFLEAESYRGPSLIIAYSHCIAHGVNMTTAMRDQKDATLSGYWPLLRYNPALIEKNKNPLQLDSGKPKIPLKDYMYKQNRFKMLSKSHPEEAKILLERAQRGVSHRYELYEHLAELLTPHHEPPTDGGENS